MQGSILCRLLCLFLIVLIVIVSVEAAPRTEGFNVNPDLYLRFRKNSANAAQDNNVQPFIRFRKSLPLRLRILQRQPEYAPYMQYTSDSMMI
uniref:Neurotransmitter-gated ion-channel ligand-binding domain-containing protein n=1 Tax=Panagrellus redivivus TaxID=6233 RepID=A0A7E4VA42_PANRE